MLAVLLDSLAGTVSDDDDDNDEGGNRMMAPMRVPSIGERRSILL